MERVLGSTILPASAEAAAVSGEQRKTESSSVPERPRKLRGVVRSELRPIAGAEIRMVACGVQYAVQRRPLTISFERILDHWAGAPAWFALHAFLNATVQYRRAWG